MKNVESRKGISLVALVITIIVLVVLTGAVVITGVNVPQQGELAVFKSNVSNVQDAVTLKMLNNMVEHADIKNDNVKWVGVARGYSEQNIANPPTFRTKINGVDTVALDESLKNDIQITEEEFEKYYVDVKGTVYHKGFSYEGVTYYNANASKKQMQNEEIKETTFASKIDSDNYGEPVSYTCEAGVTQWKIFYENGSGNVFLITSDYLPIDKVPSGTGMSTAGVYKTGWWNSTLTTAQTVSSTARTTFLSSWSDFSTNINGKCVSTLLNTDNWINLVDATYADYAIGSPTVEMWTASWNNRGYTTLYCNNTNDFGYHIGTSSSQGGGNQGLTNSYVSNSGYDNELYFLYQEGASDGCNGYWLASPQAISINHIFYVHWKGNIAGNEYITQNRGIRPVVCLNSEIEATWNGSSWVLGNVNN